MAIPTQAWAQCSPDPTQANSSVTCSGSDSNGVVITTSNSPLTVNSDASVTNAGAPAIAVSIPANSSFNPRSTSITVNGAVAASGAAGISVESGALGAATYDYYGTTANITVGASGSVSGTYGIAATQTAGNAYGAASIVLDNAGSISGSSGVALYSAGSAASFYSVTNRAGGTIGAIQANASINNAGTIDGGSLSAIAPGAGTSSYYGSINNSGTITASGAASTIANYAGQISNSGTISNTGSGGAIDGSSLTITNLAGGTITASNSSVLGANATWLSLTNAGTISNTGSGAVVDLRGTSLSVTNQAGGVISAGAGNTVLSTSTALNLVNQGTITGNVIASWGSATYTANSTVDSTAGTINGNLTLGYGSDTLIATLKNGSLYTGITGTIDGGAGTNTVQLKTTSDATLSSALVLPTNFSVLDLTPASGTTLTLGSGYSASSILFDGGGTLVNQATLSGTGQIVGQASYGSYGTFNNSGSISSNNSGSTYAVNLLSDALVNTGSITATGNAVNLSSGNSFSNSGTITAGGTAASVYVGTGFTNSGTIGSTGGTGLSLMFSCTCGQGTNSGTISGAAVGLNLNDGTLVNTGTISAAGTAVALNTFATIDNRAGGVISGGTNAIALSYPYTLAASVYNAGTINGNVNIANPYSYTTGFSTNTYVAAAGGVLNGNLTLGYGDTLVTALQGSTASSYAGINGTVYANNSALRYDVTADASDTLSSHAGFSTLGYQIGSGATLTLGTSGIWGSTITLAGTGAAVLDGSVATTNQAALTSTTAIVSGGVPAATVLAITNDGTLAMTRTSTAIYAGTVQLPTVYSGTGYTGSTFTNNGTVSLTDTTGVASSYAAVNAFAVVNNGTISASGGSAVSATSLTNTGTISASANAVLANNATITNSGAITSTNGAAVISTGYYGAGDSLINQAGGTITGSGTAVQMIGGLVSNAGTINGDVNLAYATYGGVNSVSGIYVANGGTLNGNLTFGNGSAFLVETGSGLGVTGTITTGSGTNWLGHQRSGTASVALGGALPAGFTREFTIAAGAASQVTITGPSAYTGDIIVGGDGTIINKLATTGMVYGLGVSGLAYTPYLNTGLAGFSNQANIGGAVLQTAAFSNTATIGSASLNAAAVALTTDKGFTFSNSGTIVNKAQGAALSLSGTTTASSTIANSGTITGGMYVSVAAAAGTSVGITNSGTITGYTATTYVYDPTAYPYYYRVVTSSNAVVAYATGAQGLSLANSGTISGDIALSGSNVTLVNTGSITGNITTGTGDDSLAMNGAFAGSVNAGTGTNTLSINGGTQSAPVAFTSVSNIAALTQSGGFATVSGTGTFGTATLTGGRLVGLAGSVLNASSFTVGSGATFGSAGTVNGNVIVSGVLSPGASPGTMTVNGNVTLASGSTSLFEITPTVSDKLVVNGKLAILSGSTLQIAASTPLKVGTTLDLISASGGVTGSYDTVSGIAGVVRSLANGDVGLLVQFANPATYTPQVRGAIAYLNNAMAASSAPAALFPALSALQDGNGAPIAAAFARLTPEPYADAMQIGTETALSLSGTARSIGAGETGGPAHLFAFGQALGSMRQFASHEEQGVSHATVNGFGALGGLGVAGEGYSFAGYVGWVEQDQSIGALGALTRARGAVGGVAASFGDATRITLSANYDNAHALTRRYVPDAGTISTSYALPSWSFDGSLSRALPLGQGWLLRPQVGTTWVMTSHDAISEASTHPFALTVDAASQTQGFVDAGLGFETAADAKGPWRRFLTLGARYRVQGDQSVATAALAGYMPGLTALGVGRNRLDATMAAGVEYRLAPGASLFLNASGELGKASKRESVTTGVRFSL